jgi:hypothetical protein
LSKFGIIALRGKGIYMLALRNNYFKSILFFVAFAFLFLTLGAQFLHNHTDLDFRDDCPACNWLIISVFVFTILLVLFGLVRSSKAYLILKAFFILKFYITSQYLRGPPVA